MDEVRVATATGTVGRVVAARIRPGTDFITAIEQICADKGIQSAWVNCIGSLQNCDYFILERKDNVLGAGYGEAHNCAYPVELLSASGLIVEGTVHLHGTICSDDGKVVGGHIIKGTAKSLATIEIFITEICGANMVRAYDPECEANHFAPTER